MKWLMARCIQKGRQEMLEQVIQKFEQLYDDYYGQGEFKSANLVTDMVAYLQDDEDGISDSRIR